MGFLKKANLTRFEPPASDLWRQNLSARTTWPSLYSIYLFLLYMLVILFRLAPCISPFADLQIDFQSRLKGCNLNLRPKKWSRIRGIVTFLVKIFKYQNCLKKGISPLKMGLPREITFSILTNFWQENLIKGRDDWGLSWSRYSLKSEGKYPLKRLKKAKMKVWNGLKY